MTKINANSRLYRLLTMFRSFIAIYRLTPQQIDNFVKSYEIYDCDWIHGQAVKDNENVNYEQVKKSLVHWYEVLNILCSTGAVEKMYIPPTMDLNETVINNQLLYERNIIDWIDMKKGDKVFELGCGKGRVAAHLASLCGADITGVNIDKTQVDNGNDFAKQNNLPCHFINRDFNDLPFPFPDQYFDSAYEVQALSLSRDLEKLFREVHRITKPGAKVSLSEWVRLPNYDPNNPHHVELLRQIKPLVGAIGTPSVAEYETALRNAGFNVLLSYDPSVNKSQVQLVKRAGGSFDKFLPLIHFLVKVRILPKHFTMLFERLGRHSDALCEADRLGLVTMSYQIVAQRV